MATSDPNSEAPLSRSDQVAVAAILAVAILALAVYWLRTATQTPRTIHLETAPPLRAEYRVDINQANWPELAQLPGVGEMLAKRIVADRKRRGPFRSHDDLNRVAGIGPRKSAAIRPYLLPLP